MSDLISRQALIEHLRRTIEASSNDGDYNEGFNDGMDFAACFASTLPSAQPERKKGKWIHDGCKFKGGNDWVHCSECGHREVMASRTNFCPNCGADMRGERNESNNKSN